MYVLRLLYIDTAVKSKLMDEWVLPESHTKHRVAIDRLEQLRVFLLASEGSKEQSYKLNPKFQKQLRQALASGGAPPKDPLPSNIAVRLPSSAELDSYAMKQWEGVLLQLVSTAFPESSHDISRDRFVIETFQRAKLLDSGMKLTEAGFQFLLMDTSYQLWQIVREYISATEDRGINNVELIRFLLELGFHVVGQPYNRDTLSNTEQTVLEELKVLGLVQLQQGMKHRWFIPTKLATNLATSLSDVSSRYQSDGFIIIETNFRLYAYTSSKLQIQILRLFARIEYLLPNLTVGTLNRESIQTAFASGISADQIITFLQQNAHPYYAQKQPSVPETVSDQIRLWETDSNRVKLVPACYYDDFPSMEIFESVCTFAGDRNGLVWQDSSKRRLIVQADLHDEIHVDIVSTQDYAKSILQCVIISLKGCACNFYIL
ncbi:hypothetical protein GOP47_0017794 [Adiantum capillus-veneris]|uniref:RNA polymerase II transcription factor B subunit 2 n=1 Tax=Adiantum capillus-veneris TaxID=13818 RepID=A0A9D4UG26_ADICA|nr:hypothetical protein GOP47_0017794 [Adiantum capillus-veneris]